MVAGVSPLIVAECVKAEFAAMVVLPEANNWSLPYFI